MSGAPEAAQGAPGARRRKLVFVGFMGSGKTTAAKAVAEALGARALDSDTLVEDRLGQPIDAIFAERGEAAFRAAEEEVVLELLEGDAQGSEVVSLGGGAVASEQVRAELAGEDTVTVYLEADPERAWERVSASAHPRPLARDRDAFLALHAERVPLYESVANAWLPAAESEVARRAAPLLAAIAEPSVPGGLRLLWGRAASGDCPVLYGNGALRAAGVLWGVLGSGRPVCVTDENVAREHLAKLIATLAAAGLEVGSVAIPAGEGEKTLARAEEVLRSLAQHGVDRSDTVVALGGGVVGDLAGFCAATYQRGIAVVQVPTTLVAQVDSAYGGKTGVDLPEAKNYVGAYHQPRAVLCDPAMLATLPDEELRAGFAEVLKTALIAGGALWDSVRALEPVERSARSSAAFEHVVTGCIRTKLAVVAEDERDAGRRAVLNLGHTVGHAIEAATGYRAYRHGEAVGLGLLAELRLAEHVLGLDPAVRVEVGDLLARHGLPTQLEHVPAGAVAERTALDKKRIAGRDNFALPAAPGDVRIGQQAPPDLLVKAIEELTW